jgi:large subunit ribosomal protein L22
MMARAFAKSVRVSPRKAALLATAVRGRKVEDALSILRFSPQAAARPLSKVIASAAANAQHNEKLSGESLVVSELRADAGPRLKRWRPAARGRSHPYQHATTHLTVVVTGAPAKPKRATPPTPKPEPVAEKNPEKQPEQPAPKDKE